MSFFGQSSKFGLVPAVGNVKDPPPHLRRRRLPDDADAVVHRLGQAGATVRNPSAYVCKAVERVRSGGMPGIGIRSRCFNCGEPGHLARDCPSAARGVPLDSLTSLPPPPWYARRGNGAAPPAAEEAAAAMARAAEAAILAEEAEKAALKSEVASLRRKVSSLEAELARATSVPVINAETGAVTREPIQPKRLRDDDVPPASGLKALKAASDATAGALVKVKREREDALTRVECVVCMERPRGVLFLPCNHLVVCASCATDACPFCTRAVESQITVANAS